MPFQEILSAGGPLPIKATFKVNANGPVDFVMTATCGASAANFVGVAVLINSTSVGDATMYAGAAVSHMALPTLFATADIADPTATQTITILSNSPSTTVDQNDMFKVWVHY